MPLTPNLTKFTTASPVIASYNYLDIASGEGLVEFYLYSANESTTTTPSLTYGISTNSKIVSDNPFVGISTINTNEDFTFDSNPFKSSRQLKGNIIFTIPMIVRDGDNDTAIKGDITVSVYHYDGTTQTQLGNSIKERLIVNSLHTGCGVLTGKISSQNILFKVGDMLRVIVNCKLSGTNEQGSSSFCKIICDPSGKTDLSSYEGDTRTSISKLILPFKLDL